jgi:methylated-DNA-[protein]-cysteine S-methyltransferase
MTSAFIPPEPNQPTWYDIVGSPIGRLMLTGDERALSGLFMMDTGGHSMTAAPEWRQRPGAFGSAADQLAEYFAGSRTEFDLPLAPRGTPFQVAVWAELTQIPYGVTASYGEVPPRLASRRSPPAPSVSPTAATRSRSSCPVTA